MKFSVLSWNIQWGNYRLIYRGTSVLRAALFIKASNADIVCVQEAGVILFRLFLQVSYDVLRQGASK